MAGMGRVREFVVVGCSHSHALAIDVELTFDLGIVERPVFPAAVKDVSEPERQQPVCPGLRVHEMNAAHQQQLGMGNATQDTQVEFRPELLR